MISPYDAVGERAPRPQGTAISDLLMRGVRDIGGIRFASLDELGADQPAHVPLQDEKKLEAEAAAELLQVRVNAARAEALAEARRGFEMELETRLVDERQRLDRLRVEFARDRQRFFAAAESQVVKLALAIARKILQRDAMAEGLPLRSTVKAALAKVQDGSTTILRVPAIELAEWSVMFERGTAEKVEVVGDERMARGDCVLETKVGVVELGLDVQMDEVDRGFGELMQEQGY
jgi:flagellar assembly protein FliH